MAELGIPLAAGCGLEGARTVLRGCLLPPFGGCKCDWDARSAHALLTGRPATFEFLRLTVVLKDRAARLALEAAPGGDKELALEGVAAQGLQVGCMLGRVLLWVAERTLRRADALPSALRTAAALRIDWTEVDGTFAEALHAACLAPDATWTVRDMPVPFWVRGATGAGAGGSVEERTAAVAVPVCVQVRGLCRAVMPCVAERRERCRCGNAPVWYCERYVRGDDRSAELEWLCAEASPAGHRTVRVGDACFAYSRATVNDAGDTLYLVCAGRTMRIRQAGLSPPGSVPREMTALDEAGDRYLVEFDNGLVDAYRLSFRAHKENEEGGGSAGVRKCGGAGVRECGRGGEG